jgi:hypothetical protein
MPAIQSRPARRTRKSTKQDRPVTAARVREMLREITFALHATRVVGRVKEGPAAGQK